MNYPPIEPGAVLGVLGGGQLGAMFAEAAGRLGYRVAVWDPDPDAPAHRLATYAFPASFSDQQALAKFADLVSVVTYEWENVPATLCQDLERTKSVLPSSALLRIVQDRLEQKGFLAALGFPVPHFAPLTDPSQLRNVVERIGYPALCKTATAGYDGKGQWRLCCADDIADVARALREAALPGLRWIVESCVPFERELSILVARGADGEVSLYPLVENKHEDGILRTTLVPAPNSSTIAAPAAALGRNVVERLGGIGVFCLELFQLPQGELLINEIAPRPHNSGHYTLDACTVSQFEQQVRAICGLPLGEARLLSSAVMVNVIGNDAVAVMTETGQKFLIDTPGTKLHLYGKRAILPRRKMGHVTFLGEPLSLLRDRANHFVEGLATQSPPSQ